MALQTQDEDAYYYILETSTQINEAFFRNYSVLFLTVTHKEDAFRLVLIWITIRSLSQYFLPPLSFIKP